MAGNDIPQIAGLANAVVADEPLVPAWATKAQSGKAGSVACAPD